MNDHSAFIRAIRGPVLLILLGGLFALDSFNGISFGRTWPVLLIVFGLLKAMERMGNKTA
jgi:LiaI-LiaF-like transmembrane region